MTAADPLRALQVIPGVGPVLAGELLALGCHRPEDLRGQNPEDMYRRLCELRQTKVDRCVLYVFRCAVYYAQTECPDPDLLRWWRWKDA